MKAVPARDVVSRDVVSHDVVSHDVVSYDTGTLPARSRAAFWRDAVCSTFVSVDCRIPDAQGFSGSIATRRLAGLGVSRVRSGRHEVRRIPRFRAGSAEDTVLISYQWRGTSSVVQDGRTAVLRPGTFALYDTSRPYELHLGAACEQIVLSVTGAEARLGQTRILAARAVEGDQLLGPLVGAMFRRLGRLDGAWGEVAQRHLRDAALSVLAANFAVVAGSVPDPQRSGRALVLLRSKAFVEEHLGDCDLDSGEVARAAGVSVRYLQEIFQADRTTLMAYVWDRRLQRAKRLLGDVAWRGSSVGEIALACGFKDFSHFSRRFHAGFGRSPSEARKEWPADATAR